MGSAAAGSSGIQASLGIPGGQGGSHRIDWLRQELQDWRRNGWPGATSATRTLLEWWSRSPGQGAERPLFFAQREAVEAAVYLTESVRPDHWMLQHLRETADDFNGGLLRVAFRMATGTGKTAVMACLIAWYAVNRGREHRASRARIALARNVDRVVVVCPGRTIRARLQEIVPGRKDSVFEDPEWELVPKAFLPRVRSFPVNIVNWERLDPQAGLAFAGLGSDARKNAALAGIEAEEALSERETHEGMWTRIISGRRRIRRRPERVVVFNDEGHHCWERKPGTAPGVWMEALHALEKHPRHRLAQVFDFSATPIFIDPSKARFPDCVSGHRHRGRRAGLPRSDGRDDSLFPWIVSEFALAEAMESGLVKIPQIPRVEDGVDLGDDRRGTMLNLFDANQGRRLKLGTDSMRLPANGARLLYESYQRIDRDWSSSPANGHPVLIVVADRKENAQALFELLGGRRDEAGNLRRSDFPLFTNVPRDGADEGECGMNTILVISKSDPEKQEHVTIQGGMLGIHRPKGAEGEGELREVLQTVARPGGRGESVRCVVSVGMLTEGWDCQRVTHIMGYRKFGSQLLCEQTMGRALRRRDYVNVDTVERRGTTETSERLRPEHAVVFGVPFAEARDAAEETPPEPPPTPTEIAPIAERHDRFAVYIPDIAEYQVSPPGLLLELDEGRVRRLDMDGLDRGRQRDGGEAPAGQVRTVDAAGPIGEIESMKDETRRSPAHAVWMLAAELAGRLVERDPENAAQVRREILFAESLRVVRAWLAHPVVAAAGVNPEALEREGIRDAALDEVLAAVRSQGEPLARIGIPQDATCPLRHGGQWRKFTTILRDVPDTGRSELNAAACHSKLEARIVGRLESSRLVAAHLRNHGPDRIEIPYRHHELWSSYVPDFFVRLRTPADMAAAASAVGLPVEIMMVLEGKGDREGRDRARDESKKDWTLRWWLQCADGIGAERGQIWTHAEIETEKGLHRILSDAVAAARKRLAERLEQAKAKTRQRESAA